MKSLLSRFSVLLFLVLFLSGLLQAQNRRGGPAKPYAQRPAIGELRGVVLDSISLDPLPYATIKLALMSNDSVVGGALTDEKGRFRIGELRQGRYKVEIASMGYALKTTERVRINRESPQVDLGRIGLRPKAVMEDVEIRAEKDFMLNKIDRKVYDVSRNLVTVGGDAQDVLNTIPSVEVDINGNVALRGNQSVTILVDGKPSGLTGAGRQAVLDQIPASSIAKVEVITNPSARFDPDGVSGIINIVTKKNKRAGLNGTASLAIGTRDKYNASATLNYRNARFNAFGTYSYRLNNRFSLGLTDRNTIRTDTTFRILQDENGDRRNQNHLLNGGIDFFLTPKATIGFAGTARLSDQSRSETIRSSNFDSADRFTSRFDRITSEAEDEYNYQGEVFFQQKFAREGRQLDLRASHNESGEEELGEFASYDVDEDGIPLGIPPSLQNNLTLQGFQFTQLKADYTSPLSDKAKVEAGAQSTFRTIDNDFRSESFNQAADAFLPDSLFNNSFIYREQIHAAYATYARTFGKLSLQGGLRAEQALTNFILETTNETFENNYFNIFPSGFLAYKPVGKTEIRLSYSRRINRPRTRQLNPFTDFSDTLNLRFGNPALLPEYVNSYEFSFARRIKGGNFTTSLYYRRTNGLHTRFLTVNDDGVGIRTFVNASFADDVGLEAILQMRPKKWWDLTISGNVVQTWIDASNVEADLTAEAIAGSARMVTSMRNKKGSSFQLMVNYRSPRIRPQGRISAFFFVDAAVKQEVLKGKGDVSLRVSDIFNTLRFEIDAVGEGFTSYFLRDWESQIGFLSFSYRFGKQDKRGGRRGGQRGGGGGGGMDFDI